MSKVCVCLQESGQPRVRKEGEKNLDLHKWTTPYVCKHICMCACKAFYTQKEVISLDKVLPVSIVKIYLRGILIRRYINGHKVYPINMHRYIHTNILNYIGSTHIELYYIGSTDR